MSTSLSDDVFVQCYTLPSENTSTGSFEAHLADYYGELQSTQWVQTPWAMPVHRTISHPDETTEKSHETRPFITYTQGTVPLGMQICQGPPVYLGHITIPIWGNFQLIPIVPKIMIPPLLPTAVVAQKFSPPMLQTWEEWTQENFERGQQILLDEQELTSESNVHTEASSQNIDCTKAQNIDSQRSQPVKFCLLCKSNREMPEIYMSHTLKDDSGRVICPILRSLTCTVCGASGDDSHTMKYCPKNSVATGGHPELHCNVEVSEKQPQYRIVRTSTGKYHSLKY